MPTANIQTRITKFLDARGVPYRILPHRNPVFTVEAGARERGVSAADMVKCILLREKKSRRFALACAPGNVRLDPQAVRPHLPGVWKRLSFAADDEIRAVTGYVKGAMAPLDLPAGLPVIFDEAIARREKVSISSGDPMAGLELDSRDLIRLSGAKLAPIAAPAPGGTDSPESVLQNPKPDS